MDYADKRYLRGSWADRLFDRLMHLLDLMGEAMIELVESDPVPPAKRNPLVSWFMERRCYWLTRHAIVQGLRSPEHLWQFQHGIQLRCEDGLIYVEPVAEPQSLYEIDFETLTHARVW
jgi:hypothetical protein